MLREVGNHSDTFAVAAGTVGNIPRCVSSIFLIFIWRGGNILYSYSDRKQTIFRKQTFYLLVENIDREKF